ncbi:hypothetical protein [Spongiivirga citrea]|uniref:Uncharacterized protein n=1 Tax=Spongiivirga citrea TaxID=1481457 RepID=A0A6M0CH74_9FLAO|nr:hypothetical protein [Spongiivirga citrea]NER17286.1 hypothetical protein [Spongiivirga citrea]
MKRKLEKELNDLAVRILKMKDETDIVILQKEAKRIYEKLTVMRFLETNFSEDELDLTKVNKKEALGRLSEKMNVPEENPNQEDIRNYHMMDTIKDMVTEMPKEETLDDILKDIVPPPVFEKSDMTEVTPTASDIIAEKRVQSINDSFKKELNIGLNDKIAFIKHLFEGKSEAYDEAVAAINKKDSFDDAESYIKITLKPKYNYWLGKEDYADRFMEVVESRFA